MADMLAPAASPTAATGAIAATAATSAISVARPAPDGARAPLLGWLLACTLLLTVLVGAFAQGKFPVAPADLLRSVLARLTGSDAGLPPAVETVIWNIRLPRVAAGLLVGASLAAAGQLLEGTQ